MSSTPESQDPGNVSVDSVAEALNLCCHLFEKGFKDGYCSDMTIEAFGKSFKLHKLILSQNSYFKVLCEGQFRESSDSHISLKFQDPNITIEAFELALHRLYGLQDIALTQTNVVSVLAMASFFDMPCLGEQCLQFITSSLSAENMPAYISFVDTYDYGAYSMRVRNAVFMNLCRNGWDEHRTFLPKLPLSWLESLLNSDILWVPSEYERYKLVRDVIIAKKSQFSRLSALSAHNFRRQSSTSDLKGHDITPSSNMKEDIANEKVNRQWEKNVNDFDVSNSGRDILELPEKEEMDHISSLFDTVMLECLTPEELKEVHQDIIKYSLEEDLPPSHLMGALWNQVEFRQKVLTADLSSATLSKENYKLERDQEFLSTTCISDDISRDIFNNSRPQVQVPFGVFRFSVEFDNVYEMAIGNRLYSNSIFYGGSYWRIYIQKHCTSEKLKQIKLGIYLQRATSATEDSLEEVVTVQSFFLNPTNNGNTFQSSLHYTDHRRTVKTWFQLFVVSKSNHKLIALESEPDIFEESQSWGWQSAKLYSNDYSDAISSSSKEKTPTLRISVVMGHV